MSYKIFFSNIGYARGIDGTFSQHLGRLHRHFYSGISQQQQVLAQLKEIVTTEKPDLCCFVEIDSGSFHSAYFNQVESLLDEEYSVHDVAGKYGEDSILAQMPFFKGKCNAFVSKQPLNFEKLYFRHGSKRLIYRLHIPGNVQVFFAHFSLQAKVRAKQFSEVRTLIKECGGEAIILADFNIMQGFAELQPLLEDTDLQVLNDETEYTFMFGPNRLVLDLCICSKSLADKLSLRVIPQPFSDHAALLVEWVS